jgi:hypothetical protein
VGRSIHFLDLFWPNQLQPDPCRVLDNLEMRCEEESREILERKIQGLCRANEEIIQRITEKAQTNGETKIYDYLIVPETLESIRHPYRYTVEEVEKVMPCKQIVDEWRVPVSAQLPSDPDPEETMYGKKKDLMNMTCQNFADLVRINQQVVIAKKYTTMLVEPYASSYGQKFKQNFELVQVLLGMLEAQLMGTESILEEKQESIHLFAKTNMFSQSLYSFADNSIYATMATTYQVNKGTLLSTGIHRWRVRCVNVVAHYDLGVASASHTTYFNTGTTPPTAWGLRENGYSYPGGSNTGAPYKTGDILSFTLDCTARSLTISINERHVATHSNIILPVHIAFSGGAQARAEIL